EVVLQNRLAVLPCSAESGFVHHVGKIGARKTGGAASQNGKIDIFRERNLAGVHAQNLFASAHVGTIHHHAAIETSGTKQCWVENVRPVGRSHQNDAFIGFEAIHFHQQLVQSLLALIVTAAQASSTMPANCVDLVNEDNAGGILLALLEQIADAARAHADE